MKSTTKRAQLANRLKSYSHMVSNTLEFSRDHAPKVAAASAALLTANHAAEAAIQTGMIDETVTAVFPTSSKAELLFQNFFNVGPNAQFGISAAWFFTDPPFAPNRVAVGVGQTSGPAFSSPIVPLNGEAVAVGGPNAQPLKLQSGDIVDGNLSFTGPRLGFFGNSNAHLVQFDNASPPVIQYPGNNWGDPNAIQGQTSTGWVGIEFDSTGGADKHYGAIQVRITHNGADGQPGELTAIQYAFNDVAGEAYTVGVPEPSAATGLGALALGAVGIRSMRRKRREAKAASNS